MDTLTAQNPPANHTFNLSWIITLFGTAVGAGILFLPINAGSFGFWPLVVASVLIGPMTYLAHRAFEWMISFSPHEGKDVLATLTDYFGQHRGVILALIYWFTIFPVVLIYGVSITNTVDSFIVNQLGGPSLSRWILAPLLVGAMTLALAFGNTIMLAIANIVVYPLIIALAAVSIYLIPQWDLGSFMEANPSTPGGMISAIILILPVLVFSFSYVAALSQFSLDMERKYGPHHDKHSNTVILWASTLLVVFTMFFVWSCALAMGADGMQEANDLNLPVLSYFANVTGTPFMAYMAPVVVVCAIASSYFGHSLGAVESTEYLFKLALPGITERMGTRTLNMWTYFFIFCATSLVAIGNPSILDMISVVGGIFFAFMTYLLPVIAISKIDALARFRGRKSNVFIAVMGVIVLIATIWGMVI
ncbi:Threonine/serine transporter [Corynebacterium renale]|uniref:amino acid permease n=1 Tax=Corynebacterium renale TaxID=1724 RepID=UPI000DA33588|nr:septum formation initiator [Corynebacterium renale]SQG63901.1 Threonine/serine transporter [Corynebacterium renale]STD02788.1 Threonine/serine transporter [Corynebacterium renale]